MVGGWCGNVCVHSCDYQQQTNNVVRETSLELLLPIHPRDEMNMSLSLLLLLQSYIYAPEDWEYMTTQCTCACACDDVAV